MVPAGKVFLFVWFGDEMRPSRCIGANVSRLTRLLVYGVEATTQSTIV
jgi:hypothetical protein